MSRQAPVHTYFVFCPHWAPWRALTSQRMFPCVLAQMKAHPKIKPGQRKCLLLRTKLSVYLSDFFILQEMIFFFVKINLSFL